MIKAKGRIEIGASSDDLDDFSDDLEDFEDEATRRTTRKVILSAGETARRGRSASPASKPRSRGSSASPSVRTRRVSRAMEREIRVNLSNESFQRDEGVDGAWDGTVPPPGSRRRHYHVKHKIGGLPFSQGHRSSSRPREPLIVREVTQVVDDDGPQVPVGYTGTRMDWTLNPDGTLQVVVGPPLTKFQESELKKMHEIRHKASQAKLETGRLEDAKK